MDPQSRINYLTEYLHKLNHAYYQEDISLVSDFEFDRLLKELQELEAAYPNLKHTNSPTERIGGTVTKNFANVAHRYPMLSLANSYSIEDIKDWKHRCEKALNLLAFEIVCEQKFDGVAISLTYKNGQLIQALTRGDGIQGDDITTNAKTIKNLPLVLHDDDFPDDFEVRGEVYLPIKNFEKLNAELEAEGLPTYANPRNTASGTLKLQDSKEVASRGLYCYCYALMGEVKELKTHSQALIMLKKWGFPISDTYAICRSVEEIEQYITLWDKKRHTLPLATDGVVLKVNSYELQEALGFTAKSPRWAIAYKYKATSVSTQLLSVSYQVGRTGAVTPVANMSPVTLAGTTVKRATLHNADEMERLDLHDRDTVWIEKGGEIIPKITSVEISKRKMGAKKINFITHCPECNTPLIRKPEEAVWYCPNEKGCPPQIKGRIEHFIHRKAINLDTLGEGKIELLYEKGLIRSYADLYDLTYEKLFGLEKIWIDHETRKEKKIGFKEKTVVNLLQAIENSKKVPFHRVLFGLGIKYVGATVAEKLASYFQNIDNLAVADLDTLTKVPEIGEKIAQSVTQWFSDPENITTIQRLKSAGLQFTISDIPIVQKSSKLEGKTFLVSGTFSLSRDALQQTIIEHGGRLISGVSSKLDYLVAGENMGPSKLEKATNLQVKIISEKEFFDMLI